MKTLSKLTTGISRFDERAMHAEIKYKRINDN